MYVEHHTTCSQLQVLPPRNTCTSSQSQLILSERYPAFSGIAICKCYHANLFRARYRAIVCPAGFSLLYTVCATFYFQGSSIIRMLSGFLGTETFVAGLSVSIMPPQQCFHLRSVHTVHVHECSNYMCILALQSYLEKYKFSSAETKDLWNSLAEVRTAFTQIVRNKFYVTCNCLSNWSRNADKSIHCKSL